MTGSFNPLAMESLAESILGRLMANAPQPLGLLPRFSGAGIYAIYYVGDFPVYDIITQANANDQWELPIYVGKAVPKGGRQGIDVSPAANTAVWSRLRSHARSIEQATNLDLAHFFARWLIVDDIWIALGESALLRHKRPLWSAMVDGFGNHDPGKGRRAGLTPQWDTLHPGRPWAESLEKRPDIAYAQIEIDALEYLQSRHSR